MNKIRIHLQLNYLMMVLQNLILTQIHQVMETMLKLLLTDKIQVIKL